MIIGGLQKFSLIDYPGKICATIFTQGCNFNCSYCYNKALIDKTKESIFTEDEVFSFLKSRINKLQALCICGGEPTIHADLPDFMRTVKAMGFLVKLDTNGYNPDMLEEITEKRIVDFIAMDIKAPFGKYGLIAGTEIDFEIIKKSVSIIKSSGIPYIFRTTYVKPALNAKDILSIMKELKPNNDYIVQEYLPPASSNFNM